MIEKTRIPSGSRRLRPTGNLCCNFRILHCTSLLVVQIINVHRRSRAESTREAMSDNDDELKAAMTFATRRAMLAITLTYLYVSVATKSAGAEWYSNIDGPLRSPLSLPSALALILRE